MLPNWLKFKKYPHIGKPLTKKDTKWIISYVTNPENIVVHKFVPMLHRSISCRRYRPEENATKNKSGKRQRVIHEKKERSIFYCSHLDSMIYGYYNYLLTIQYEKYLNDKPFNKVAAAYRKVSIENNSNKNKCNIEFAFDTFKFIEDNKDRTLSVIVADVTSFFDNLEHRLLHTQWKRVLGVDNLPDDHYALYRNLIAKRYINENELFKRFQSKLYVERNKPNDTTRKQLRRKHVGKIYNMRQENVVAFCDKKEFFKEAIDLIRIEKPLKNTLREANGREILKGIPQGTPISATLANIYMLDFDEKIHHEVTSISGYYQRYSDDLVVVCDQKNEDYIKNLLTFEIENMAKLEIQTEKTKIYRYELDCYSEFKGGVLEDGVVNGNKQLEYLGFEYNGSKVRVKSASFSKFHRNMKRSFSRGVHFAKKAHIKSDALFETRLYKRFTHLGSKRRLRYHSDPKNPKKFIRTTQYYWGNFISYLNKANEVMRKINCDDTIKNQYSSTWNLFHDIKKHAYKKIAETKK